MSDKVVKVGQTLSWEVQFGGEPPPEAQWFRGSEEVKPDEHDRVAIDRQAQKSTITVRLCERADTATYRLVLTNSSGSCETSADGVVLGKPSRPTGPFEVVKVRAKKAIVKWNAPEDDGGTPISHFELEKLDEDTGRWVPCGEVPADARDATIDGLQEGKKYKFRVRAVNKEGRSEPLESEKAVLAKNPYREPDPPRDLTIYDWDNQSVTLRWEIPLFDGGRPITHYLIEQKGKYDVDFVEVQETEDASLETVVTDLKEKQVFQWRVRAVNKAGKSLPCEPTPNHLVKHRHSKIYI